MRSWLILLFVGLVGSVAQAKYQPRLFDIDCKNVKAVAKEAVAYSLVGAWTPYTNHTCFRGETFKYFNPRAGRPEGDAFDLSKVIRFKKGRDSYHVTSIKKKSNNYEISVSFKIAGKPLDTTYLYYPDPEYTGRTGICGFVINPTDVITRQDCMKHGQSPSAPDRTTNSVKGRLPSK